MAPLTSSTDKPIFPNSSINPELLIDLETSTTLFIPSAAVPPNNANVLALVFIKAVKLPISATVYPAACKFLKVESIPTTSPDLLISW